MYYPPSNHKPGQQQLGQQHYQCTSVSSAYKFISQILTWPDEHLHGKSLIPRGIFSEAIYELQLNTIMHYDAQINGTRAIECK